MFHDISDRLDNAEKLPDIVRPVTDSFGKEFFPEERSTARKRVNLSFAEWAPSVAIPTTGFSFIEFLPDVCLPYR